MYTFNNRPCLVLYPLINNTYEKDVKLYYTYWVLYYTIHTVLYYTTHTGCIYMLP